MRSKTPFDLADVCDELWDAICGAWWAKYKLDDHIRPGEEDTIFWDYTEVELYDHLAERDGLPTVEQFVESQYNPRTTKLGREWMRLAME